MPESTTPVAAPLQNVLQRADRLRRRRARRRRLVAAMVAASTVGAWPLAMSLAATTPPSNTPGSLTGWAFDACSAPSAGTMDAWLQDKTNPYRGMGIYISGSLRACAQSHLTPSWVSHVQATGWHLLPLTVGPQASCSGFSQSINSRPTNTYVAARQQGAGQADQAVAAARALGINPGSTLFYDMENWHTGYNDCDASTLWFMSAWSNRLHAYGYAGGVYVSGLSGARLLNAMANNLPSGFVLPDQIWTAEWNNQENTRSNYLDANNWANHQRAHQYFGGHDATNSGITLNIDSNYVDLRPVSPIPAVVPDSAIGAIVNVPTPVPSVIPTVRPTPKPTAKPTLKPSVTPTLKPTAKPTVKPSVTPTATPTVKPTVKPSAPSPSAKPTTRPTVPTLRPTPTPTHPAPVATTTSPKPTPEPTHTSTPATVTSTVNTVTTGLGTATGIKLPTLRAAHPLAPKLAARVPTMEAAVHTVTRPAATTRTLKIAQPSASATPTAPEPNAAKPNDAQAAPLQPTLPVPIPATTHGPSLVAQIWHGTEGVLLTIGHALAGAAAWVGRGFGSMLGW
ncbi:MAG: hypothetical protein NVSMB48_25670 [Marmoricola sp.]